MRAMRTLLQTIIHNVVVATMMPSSRQNASVTSTDQRRSRHKKKSNTHDTVAPLSTSVHRWRKPIDSSMPGITDVDLWEDGNPAVYITPKTSIRSFSLWYRAFQKYTWLAVSFVFNPFCQRSSGHMASLCMHREPSDITSCISKTLEDLFLSNFA